MTRVVIDRAVVEHALEALTLLEKDIEWQIGSPTLSVLRKSRKALRAALAQRAEPELSRCPQCNGPADNGFDRSFPPSPYLCKKCMAEPVEEPVAWMCSNPELMAKGYERFSSRCEGDWNIPVYTAPPRRTMVPLTEEEIKTAFHAARNAKLGASQDNSRHRLSVIEIARAVEKASWEKNHGKA